MVDFKLQESTISAEKQAYIDKIHARYEVSPFILENFTLGDLVEMERTLILDPWNWFSKDKGFTVAVADKVAKHCNVPFDGRRNKAVYMASLESVIDFGHCYARDYQLKKNLEFHEFPMDDLIEVQEILIKTKKIIITKGGKIYPTRLIYAERYFAQALVDLDHSAIVHFDNVAISHPSFDQLADEQKQVVLALQKTNLVILTGLPGTGKTKTISVISQIYGEENVVLCAPTGKAAKRMTELCGMEARTLHSILFFTDTYEGYNIEGNETLREKLVIVDEASMMDIEIAGKLAIALDKTTCKLLIVGDSCQLPSVGPGEVLKQIVESGVGIHCHLTQIKRQQPGSIIQSAHAIANGQALVKGEDKEVQTYFYGNTPVEELIKKIARSDKWKDAQFLTVLKEHGSEIINPIIQNVVNPGSGRFRDKDKILHLKNDKQNNVMNGDMGIIRKSFKTGDFIAEFSDQREVYYNKKMQWMVDLAYAFTVHKSQGSEFDKVVFFLNKSRITTRNLLYTGLTRAKKQILIIAENEEILCDAIDNLDKGRQSSLKGYIQYFQKEKTNGPKS
jgi:exodeoxyribonuclease V alpha subunit